MPRPRKRQLFNFNQESREGNNNADPAKVPRLSLVLHERDSTSINCQSSLNHQPSTTINCQSSLNHQPSTSINCQSPVNHQPSFSINCQSPVNHQSSTSINCQSSVNHQSSTSINCQSPVNNQSSTSMNCQSPVNHQSSTLINCQSSLNHQPSTSMNCQSPVNHQSSTLINCQSSLNHQSSTSINCQSPVNHQPSNTTNLREASTRANAVIRNIVKLENSEKRLRKLEDLRLRASRRLKVETCTQYSQRLEDLRQRASHRLQAETCTQYSQRLEDLRQRASQRLQAETCTQYSQRLEDLRQRASQRLQAETCAQYSQRLEDLRQTASQRLQAETCAQYSQRLDDMRQRNSRRYVNETPIEYSKRLDDLRRRASQRLETESPTEYSKRLYDMQNRALQRTNNETPTQRNERLEEMRQQAAIRLSEETHEQRIERLEEMRQGAAIRLSKETHEQRNERLEEMRQRATLRLSAETKIKEDQRLEEQRRRDARRRAALEKTKVQTYKSAVNSSVNYRSLGPFTITCIHCQAIHFPEERVGNKVNRDSFGDCCLHGRISLEAPIFPNELIILFLGQHPLAQEFHKKIRNLNACFSLASFNVDDDRTINSHGIYSFIAAGMIYHKINLAVHPTQNPNGDYERPQYGQLYFLDPDDAVNERIHHPYNSDINQDLMNRLEKIIRAVNCFAQAFKMMREVETETRQLASANRIAPPHVRLLFTNPDGFDIRRYNVPSSNEVCAVLTLNADQSIPANEMVVHQRGKEIVTLKNTDKRTEPFTYPLFYPKGTFGYSVDLKLQQPYPSRQHLTRLEMAQYRIAYRKGLTKNLPLEKDRSDLDLRETQFNALHFGGRLFQQYLVDTFIRVERDRIQWIKSNQKKILAEKYIGVSNFLKELAEKKDAVVGETIILPSSFPGSTRYYAEQFEDAMAIVRRFGSPDFFITMTCNPEWPEIKEAARIVTEEGFVIQQRAQDRPDLVARVAKLKFETIIEELYKKQIFGKVAAYVYTIEFQKRGLPHMHLLLIMRSEDKVHNPDELDDLISAEIPDNTDPELRELVLKWMIHNPCGEHDLNASCMKNHNGKIHCRFDFPKPFQETTSLVDDEKPKLRRRYDSRLDQQSPEFSHELAVYRKDKSGRRITRDNRHVAPYNAYLLKLFNCHINVEFVGSIRAVKYLYKYIYKGHDCAYIKIVEEQKRINYNEPDTYIEGRCITPPEACWRLSGNELQKKSHVVQRLDIHLPGHYRMSDIVNVQEDLADTGIKGSTLESYFKTNATKKQKEEANRLAGLDEEITYHFYWQMPEHFKWIGRTSEWVERLRQINVIGRIHSVNFVAQPELYHLRMLLYHVNDATSFDELLKFNGIRHATFKQACLARGLAYDDQQWIDGLQESAMSKTPRAMRTLFTQILIFGSPENPKRLWEMFKADLAEDFLLEIERTGGRVEDAINHTYRIIASKLNTEATEGRDFQYWVNTFGMDNIDFVNNHLNVDMLNNDCSILEGERLYGLLKGKQLDIVNTILDAVTSHNSGPRCFFIDGPGGTGKTFVYKTIYHILRGRNFNVKCMAFTGIASILLPNGRTSHKTFGLSVPLTPESVSNIKLGSMKAAQLAEVDVFLMDEAPMLPKYGLSTVDQLLRAIGNAKEPFGGKTIVLGGRLPAMSSNSATS
ncbi:uncharacterized protein LOC129921730 [Biomphalaria glabrata]|uniref:ATP-dependent DNA helicase n=1 Tax=Biomphalaria glabrata TaxID=6526 RepID=A0A9W2YC67_BIOGL|nr:uncharacterized protein LOC129921730 [Biomphalaria glabrata]